ncbi:Rv3654c family TadE-like protein [Streptomyces sp. NPDC057428]|uniref:Rv3654c family TadE-like protein n=1 Tax=Streptomyces sp. NPDC057428 TaxID=3346129 RepID=UPI0036C2EF1D
MGETVRHDQGGTVRSAANGLQATRTCGRFRAEDQGLATVWAAITTSTLCVVFAVVLALGQAVSARHRAGGAADLAALAAADRALRGSAAACGAAREVAVAQGAELVRCSVQGEIADVIARAHFGPYKPEVRSRAGPPEVEMPAERSPAPGAVDNQVGVRRLIPPHSAVLALPRCSAGGQRWGPAVRS